MSMMTKKIIRTYSELITIPTFEERYMYLRIGGKIGDETFGFDRYLNQKFYKSDEWLEVRDFVIVRDMGCDLGCPDHKIPEGIRVMVHHMNPIDLDDLVHRTKYLLDPEFLITTIKLTHDAIHYGNDSVIFDKPFAERRPNDTCPWKN